MTRSKLSTKVALLAGGIGLPRNPIPTVTPVQRGTVWDPTYGCIVAGDAYEPL